MAKICKYYVAGGECSLPEDEYCEGYFRTVIGKTPVCLNEECELEYYKGKLNQVKELMNNFYMTIEEAEQAQFDEGLSRDDYLCKCTRHNLALEALNIIGDIV